MELKEQAGIDFRDEYDRMNTALLIKEEYDTQLEAKGPGKRDEVLNIIASKIPGKDKKHVEDYLKFLEFVDLVLEALDRETKQSASADAGGTAGSSTGSPSASPTSSPGGGNTVLRSFGGPSRSTSNGRNVGFGASRSPARTQSRNRWRRR